MLNPVKSLKPSVNAWTKLRQTAPVLNKKTTSDTLIELFTGCW